MSKAKYASLKSICERPVCECWFLRDLRSFPVDESDPSELYNSCLLSTPTCYFSGLLGPFLGKYNRFQRFHPSRIIKFGKRALTARRRIFCSAGTKKRRPSTFNDTCFLPCHDYDGLLLADCLLSCFRECGAQFLMAPWCLHFSGWAGGWLARQNYFPRAENQLGT